MRWTTIGTALTLALAAYLLADRWGYSEAEAIFIPVVIALVLVGVLVATAVAASDTPGETAQQFIETVKRDFAELVKAARREDK